MYAASEHISRACACSLFLVQILLCYAYTGTICEKDFDNKLGIIMHSGGRDISKEGGVNEVGREGGVIIININSEYIRHRLLA